MRFLIVLLVLFLVGCDEPKSPIQERQFEYYQVKAPNGQTWYAHRADVNIYEHYATFTAVNGDRIWIHGDYVLQATRPEDQGQVDYQRGLKPK